jgi:hypothetical protein
MNGIYAPDKPIARECLYGSPPNACRRTLTPGSIRASPTSRRGQGRVQRWNSIRLTAFPTAAQALESCDARRRHSRGSIPPTPTRSTRVISKRADATRACSRIDPRMGRHVRARRRVVALESREGGIRADRRKAARTATASRDAAADRRDRASSTAIVSAPLCHLVCAPPALRSDAGRGAAVRGVLTRIAFIVTARLTDHSE